MSIFLGLIHHPVLNRLGEVGSTAITNVDIHDLARAGRTYGVEKLFIVTPITLQQELCNSLISHWIDGKGGKRVPTRSMAFERVEVAANLDAALDRAEAIDGKRPLLVVTGAQLREDVMSWADARNSIWNANPDDRGIMLLLGTGWGLAPEVIARADIRLPAIDGPPWAGGYNHLSVRAAGVIVLDRLLAASRE
ncbi:MAG: tRNA (guanine37-N1)-methyltransferase [Myxococcota bacterium]